MLYIYIYIYFYYFILFYFILFFYKYLNLKIQLFSLDYIFIINKIIENNYLKKFILKYYPLDILYIY